VTGRHIDAAKHAEVKERHPFARQAGPKFSFIRDPHTTMLPDDGPFEEYPDTESEESDDDDYNEYSTSGSFDPNWPGRLPHPRKVDAFGNLIPDGAPGGRPEGGRRSTRARKPTRPYGENNDSDDLPDTKRGTRKGKYGGRGTKKYSCDRSRSPDRDSKPPKSFRSRSPKTPAAVYDYDPLEGLGPIFAFNVGQLDPANVPQAVTKQRKNAAAPKEISAVGKNGERSGNKLHRWTLEEMVELKAAGLRVSQSQSTWSQEMVNLPPGVTLRNCKERYWRAFKRHESPKGGGAGASVGGGTVL
jgi:hypothetical protein